MKRSNHNETEHFSSANEDIQKKHPKNSRRQELKKSIKYVENGK